ncbi:putative phage tail protein [Methylobacterium indicum]|uniref:putative phage tail protein n=1 Tax=Methylobacterium indicum TaxID=1775910 RepID=UPI0007348382|nr:putative phage tail protein [Methylobacterium indicum]
MLTDLLRGLGCLTADRVLPRADRDTLTVDASPEGCDPGRPCEVLPTVPPSVVDRQAAPTADDLYPQIAGVLTPRGPAWGTDEAGDGRGAGPVMRGVWRALAAWTARQNADEWTLATQALPSAITYSLADWEAEYGLPDPCGPGGLTTEGRVAAVAARFRARGGASPAYFVCLAATLGYTVTIEEPTQFLCDVSSVGTNSLVEGFFRCDEGVCDDTPIQSYAMVPEASSTDQAGGDPFVEAFFRCDEGICDATPIESYAVNPTAVAWQFWVVHAPLQGESYFRCDEGVCDATPIESFTPASDLECLMRRYSPAHTTVVFNYDR